MKKTRAMRSDAAIATTRGSIVLHGGARRNQSVQSPGSESQARVGAVLQSLLRDISVSSLPSGAQRKEMVQSLGNERRGRVGGVLQSY